MIKKIIITSIILTFLISPSFCQTVNKKTIYIKFYASINDNSVDKLMSIIEQQIKDGTERFIILISSSGGNVNAGISAYNYLKGIPVEVITHNFGIADSMAMVLYCAGSKRLTSPNSRFFLHGIGMDVNSPIRFEEKKLKETIESLESQRRIIAEIISKNCNRNLSEIENALLESRALDSNQAQDWGLVHEIKSELFEKGAEVISITDISIKKELIDLMKK